jgi:lipopolysaccharide/colanic/teichoic acid biosynthesis glycosyltransferase
VSKACTPLPRTPDLIRTDSTVRRAVDVAVSLTALVLLAPALAILATLVVVSSGRPALFRQVRVGKNGEEFWILKFRTMHASPVDAPLVSGHADPRITRVGRLLRRMHMDELPQLFNLLRGELTLIGPRPEVPRYVAAYTDSERELLRVRPGLVGPGALLFASRARELDGCADPEQHYLTAQLHPRLLLDLDYIHNRTMRRDLSLAWRAALACVGHD